MKENDLPPTGRLTKKEKLGEAKADRKHTVPLDKKLLRHMRVALEWQDAPLASLLTFYEAFRELQKAQLRKSKSHRALHVIVRSATTWLVAMEMQDGGLKLRSVLDLLSDHFVVKMSPRKISSSDRKRSQERTFYIFPGESGEWRFAYLSQSSYSKGRLSSRLVAACEQVRASSDFSEGPISIQGDLKDRILTALTFYAKLAEVPEEAELKIQDKSSIFQSIRQLIKDIWAYSFESYNMTLAHIHRQPACFFLAYYAQFSAQGESRYLSQERGLTSTLADELKGAENSWEQKFRWAWEIAYGLHYLHKLGKAHLNLTPSYVLMDYERVARLANYWLSSGEKDGSRDSLYVGRSNAPELAVTQDYDKYAVDVYLYGQVLESMVSGDPHLHHHAGPHAAFFKQLIGRCCGAEPRERESIATLIGRIESHCQLFNFSLRFDRLDESIRIKREVSESVSISAVALEEAQAGQMTLTAREGNSRRLIGSSLPSIEECALSPESSTQREDAPEAPSGSVPSEPPPSPSCQ